MHEQFPEPNPLPWFCHAPHDELEFGVCAGQE
jgi:hypothetical protein